MGPNGELDRLFDTVVGTVTLRVSDVGRQRDFYEQAIGLTISAEEGSLAELSGDGTTPMVRLDSSRSAGSVPARGPHTGLFHTAFRYPDRASLGAAVRRTAALAREYQGASDHGVSEAVYFADPEGNGIELYRDRPFDEWPSAEPGKVGMFTKPLDLAALVDEASEPDRAATPDIGHIHLMTADVEQATAFWRDAVGLDERQKLGSQAVFLAEGLYHHHLAANSWQSAGAGPAPPDAPGLEEFELRLRGGDAVAASAEGLERAGVAVERDGPRASFIDVDGNRVVLSSRT
jgi:catechol 2,3-dioxygenase